MYVINELIVVFRLKGLCLAGDLNHLVQYYVITCVKDTI